MKSYVATEASGGMIEGNVQRMVQGKKQLTQNGNKREAQSMLQLLSICMDRRAEGSKTGAVMTVDAPTTPGVWRRQGKEINNAWVPYPIETAETIFTAFCNGSRNAEWVDCTALARKRKRDADDTTSSSGVTSTTHRVDFETMKEVEVSTGVEMDIKIVEAAISDVNYTPIEDPIETGVWWKHGSGKWHCYAGQALQIIRNAWRRREHLVTLKKAFTRRYPDGVKYIISLTAMIQTNPVTGHTRPIRIISNARMPSEDSSACVGRNLTIFSLGSNLLRGGLQRLMSLELLKLLVAEMVLEPHTIQTIEVNKHLHDDDIGRVTYQRFQNAYENLIKRVPGCCGQLMRLRTHTRKSHEESRPTHAASGGIETILKYAFYRAPPSEVDNILKNGVARYGHSRDHFAVTSDYYKLHDKSWDSVKYSLIVCLVVVPKDSRGPSRCLNSVPVASVDHHLPVAVVTLKNLAHSDPDLPESGQSGATDSNPDCGIPNGSLQVLCSTTSRRESVEVTATTGSPATQGILLPSRLKEAMLLLFKLYCPETEKLRFVGGLVVQAGGRPTEILGWLREMAGFAPDAEIRLYKEDSSNCIDHSSTYGDSLLQDGGVVVYNIVLPGDERRSRRCPDLPAFREYVQSRQVIRFRRLLSPTEDEFCLELSNQDTYSDVLERVAQYLGLEDDTRIRLHCNDCFRQQPKPLDGSLFSAMLVSAYKQTTSILYFEVLDSTLPELDGSKTLRIAFHNAKGEKLSVHEIELPKRSHVGDIVKELRGTVKELRNPAAAEMRIFEVYCNGVTRIHPSNERVGYVNTQELSTKLSLRATEIAQEDKDMAPKDRLLHIRHFHCRDDSSQKCDFFGEPFLMVAREHETLAHVKDRVKGKVLMSEQEFSECKFALLCAGRLEYLRDDDLVASRMQKFSMGFYDPVHYYLGLEHVDSIKSSKRTFKPRVSPKTSRAKSSSTFVNPQKVFPIQRRKPNKDATVKIRAPKLSAKSSQAKPTLVKLNNETKSPQQRRERKVSPHDEKLVLTVVTAPSNSLKRPPLGSTKCRPPAPVPLAICSPSHSLLPPVEREVALITVPDPEFHNFDLLRTEKDIVAGQVWAIYDNHDGMPRFYGYISQVSRCPFKVELSWLEPYGGKRWWVETTGLSIACGEYGMSTTSEIEKNIGVFSHLVHEKTASKGVVKVYPRKGEVWAIYRNWDILHMLGPEPMLTPNGIFDQYYQYDIVEIRSEYSEEDGVTAVSLVKSKDFKTIFHPQEGPLGAKIIPPTEMRKFSHSIPAEKVENHSLDLPQEAVELDPASLPLELTVVDRALTTG